MSMLFLKEIAQTHPKTEMQKKTKKFYLLLAPLAFLLFYACATPKALEYKGVENFYIQSLGLEQSKIGLDVRFYNPNPYSLDLKGGSIDIYINDHFLGNSSVQLLTAVPQQNSFLLPLNLDANLKGILQGALSLLSSQEVNLKLSGSVKVGKGGVYVSVPVNAVTKQKIRIR